MNTTKQFFGTTPMTSKSSFIRAIIATVLMLVFFVQTWASQPPLAGSELYVVAQSGLHMRTSPDVHANSVKLIYLGDKVTVLEQVDSIKSQKIDWVTGHWVLVKHEGDQGYIFDGYLSSLNIPTYDWEMCQLDLDMIYPLEQWAAINHMTVSTDTSEGAYITKVTERFENGNKLVKINSGNIYKIELHLANIRIMDAYHLLQNMIDDKPRLRTFQNQSIFIEANESSKLERIKVKIDNPVDIRLLDNGTVKVSIHSQEYPCQL